MLLRGVKPFFLVQFRTARFRFFFDDDEKNSTSTSLLFPNNDNNNQRLVDTAMLSAIGGLAYALGSVLRLQAYMG